MGERSDTVSGEAAVRLAHIAYEQGQKSMTNQSQRLRVQALPGVPVDIIIEGQITPAVLRNIARLLEVSASILDETDAASLEPPENAPPHTQEGER